MARGIKISWQYSRYRLQLHDGIRVRIEVICQEGFKDANIFAYRFLTTDPQTGQKEGFFSHVCSPTDMEEYGANAPIPGLRPEWFRLSYVDVLLRSMAEVDAFVTDIRDDIRRLKRTLDTMDTLRGVAEEVVGDACSTSDSIARED